MHACEGLRDMQYNQAHAWGGGINSNTVLQHSSRENWQEGKQSTGWVGSRGKRHRRRAWAVRRLLSGNIAIEKREKHPLPYQHPSNGKSMRCSVDCSEHGVAGWEDDKERQWYGMNAACITTGALQGSGDSLSVAKDKGDRRNMPYTWSTLGGMEYSYT